MEELVAAGLWGWGVQGASWVLSASVDQRAPNRLEEMLCWGQSGLCLSQEDFSCAPKGRVGVTPPGKPLH